MRFLSPADSCFMLTEYFHEQGSGAASAAMMRLQERYMRKMRALQTGNY